MRAIPGILVMLFGVLLLLARQAMGWSQGAARTLMTGKRQSETEQRTDTVLPIVIGIGVVIAGFWIAVYALVRG